MLARLILVAGAHIAVLLALAHVAPEFRKRIDPVMVSLITPPSPVEPAAPPPPRVVTKPVAKVAQQPNAEPTPAIIAAELPAAITAPASPSVAPSPEAYAGASTAAPTAPVAAVANPTETIIVPPRFDAAYLNNPRPEYPRAARRMGEHGKVLLRVYVTVSGSAEKVEIRTSSGSPRLDQAAREAVEQWKFVPARRGDQPVAAWVLVPIAFVLEG